MTPDPPVTPPPWWASWTLQIVLAVSGLLVSGATLWTALHTRQQVEEHGAVQQEIKKAVEQKP